MAKTRHPVLLGPDVSHLLLQRARILLPKSARRSLAKSLPPVHQTASANQGSKVNTATPEESVSFTRPRYNTGLQDQRNSKETPARETSTLHFCWINLLHFQITLETETFFFLFCHRIHTEFLSAAGQGIKQQETIVYDTPGICVCFLCMC